MTSDMILSNFDSKKQEFIRQAASSEKSDDLEAFYVCDTNEIKAKHGQWIEQFQRRIRVIYTVKCNDQPNVLKILNELDVKFDCASKKEIAKILALNIDPKRIIFGNPVKQITQIKYACEQNISKLTFDNKSELVKIKRHHPRAKLVLRIRHSGDEGIVQFGCKDKTHAEDLLKVAKANNLDVIGVSFNTNLKNTLHDFEKNLIVASDLFKIAREIGFDFNFLDLGNIPVSSEFSGMVFEYFDPNLKKIEISARSDRFFVGSAFTLAAKIHSKRTVNDYKMYYLGHGAFGSLNIVIFHNFPDLLKPIPLQEKYQRDNKQFMSTFWGPTCDSLDAVIKNINFPELEVGEWVVFENMGAYSLTMCSNFNGIPIPPVFYI